MLALFEKSGTTPLHIAKTEGERERAAQQSGVRAATGNHKYGMDQIKGITC